MAATGPPAPPSSPTSTATSASVGVVSHSPSVAQYCTVVQAWRGSWCSGPACCSTSGRPASTGRTCWPGSTRPPNTTGPTSLACNAIQSVFLLLSRVRCYCADLRFSLLYNRSGQTDLVTSDPRHHNAKTSCCAISYQFQCV